MSELYNLISSIVRKELSELNLTKTVPCRVINILNNEKVEVELISNKARYNVTNYSGSSVNVGETVQLFYRGIISENTAYIGASLYKRETENNTHKHCIDELEDLIDDINGEHIWTIVDIINGEVI